eukprot:6085303-Karenia_brevis.AAC.1
MVHVQQHHYCQCDSCQCRTHANLRQSKWRELSPDYAAKLSELLLNNEDGIPDNHQANISGNALSKAFRTATTSH